MAKIPDIKFDVHVCDEGRWSLFTDAPAKSQAVNSAKELLGTGKYEAVKVTEERGQRSEIIVWQEAIASRGEKRLTITPVDDVPYCESLGQFYGLESKLAIGRLLRNWLNEHCVTAAELLHSPVHATNILRDEELMTSAMNAVAAIRSRNGGGKPADHFDFLEGKAEEIAARARNWTDDAEKSAKYEAELTKNGLAGLVKGIDAEEAKNEADFWIYGSITAALANYADWDAKFEAILDFSAKKLSARSAKFCDELLAEILDNTQAVQEILGYQKNLGSALQVLTLVCSGNYRLEEGTNSPLEKLSDLIAAHGLENTQQVLMGRIGRALTSINPLTQGTREEEQDAFRELMRRLIGQKMFGNSGVISEAATLRAKSVLREEFEDESFDKAIDNMIILLPTVVSKLGYLLDLSGTPYGERCQDHIIACLASLLAGVTSVAQIVEAGSSDEKIVRAAAGIRDRLMATPLPPEWRQRFAKRIYSLLVTYTAGENQATISKGAKEITVDGSLEAIEPSGTNEAKAEPYLPGEKPVPAPKEAAKGLSDEPLRRQELAPGEYIFKEGEKGSEAYLILSGQVDIVKQVGDQEIAIAQVGQGSIIGEMALIDAEPRMASAKTATSTVLTVIPMSEMKLRLDRLEKHDPVLRRLMGMFVQRMRESRFISMDS